MAFDAEKRLIHFYTEFPYIDEDYTAYLLKRYDHTYANTWGADVFISIHCNASTNNTANGTEVYTFNTSSKALPLAKKIQSKIV